MAKPVVRKPKKKANPLKVAKVADNDGPDRPVTLDGIVASVLGSK